MLLARDCLVKIPLLFICLPYFHQHSLKENIQASGCNRTMHNCDLKKVKQGCLHFEAEIMMEVQVFYSNSSDLHSWQMKDLTHNQNESRNQLEIRRTLIKANWF